MLYFYEYSFSTEFMSIRPDNDKNYDEKKMTNFETSDSFIEYERCEMLPICNLLSSKSSENEKPPEGGNSTSTTGSGSGNCVLTHWGGK